MKSALDFEQAKIIEISTENQRKKHTISLIGKNINQHNTVVHLETAFGDEKAHGYDSLASVLACPRMSKPY